MRQRVATKQVFPPGERDFSGIPVPRGSTRVRIFGDRSDFKLLAGTDSTSVLELHVSVSEDGGATWRACGGASWVGGEYKNKDGIVVNELSLDCGLRSDPKNRDRQLRVRANCKLALSCGFEVEFH